MSGAVLEAGRIAAALSHRTWVIGGRPRCHLFLLRSGRANLAPAGQPDVEIAAPALLWLPQAARATLQVMAGGDGFSASIGPDFLRQTIGGAALTVHLRPLLDQTVLAGAEAAGVYLPMLSASFAALAEEARGQRPAAAAMSGLHLATLLLHLWRCAGQHHADQRAAGATTVQRFRMLVELHYREGLRIDEFASRLGVTRAHLHDACLRATGQTPLALLHERLLTEARARLQQTNLSVEQVGYGIGFRDPGYFNRFFKRLTGQSPGAYRRGTEVACRPASALSFAAWP